VGEGLYDELAVRRGSGAKRYLLKGPPFGSSIVAGKKVFVGEGLYEELAVRRVSGAKRERCEEISLKGSACWLVYCCGQKGGLLYKAGKKAAFYIRRAKRRPFI